MNVKQVSPWEIDVPLVVNAKEAPEIIVKTLGSHINLIAAVGSRITCSPAPVDTDEDWLVLIKGEGSHVSEVTNLLYAAGFREEGSPELYMGMEDSFVSWRLGDINVIVTHSGPFYSKFMVATELAKQFNLLDKRDRILLFQGVLYGVHPEDVKFAPPKKSFS